MSDRQPTQEISVEQAHSIDSNLVTFIDLRRMPGRHQLRGALRYNARDLLAANKLLLPLPSESTIVLYGDASELPDVAQRLMDAGHEQVYELAGGYNAWKDAGYPLEELSQNQPVPGVPDAGIPLS
ncbi:MAG: rhodanese-like domain-containing protein [Candidatus Baltobacteraceae bacterium]